MNIIITAGGTSERIDDVRKITNMATGTLGSIVADEFARQALEKGLKLFYLCGQGAAVPSAAMADIVRVENVGQLRDTLTKLLTNYKIDAVIHSMAVSDYTVSSVATVGHLSRLIAQKLLQAGDAAAKDPDLLAQQIAASIGADDGGMARSGKLSSELDDLLLILEKTPKIIGLVKQLQPSTILVGFKLLDGVTEQNLVTAGYELLKKNRCDFVLANDRRNITPKRHVGCLIQPDGSFQRLKTKNEIAKAIVENVLERTKKRENE